MNNTTSRVLIVDDMPVNRLVLSSLLATHGVMSDQAESGMECIELCENNDYDLILLDHRMPDMDGVDTLVHLKKLFSEKGKDTPVVCHTTDEGRQNVNLYKAAGFADVLIKPIEPGELFNVIMTYLPERSEEKKAYEPVVSMTVSEADSRLEIEQLPLWLKTVPHIDLVAGIANCGCAEDYTDALYIFYTSVEEKADEIQSFLDAGDWTMYALRVHSLKSMARLVGARELGEMATHLEKACRENDITSVREDTPEFLKTYREFSVLLSHFAKEEQRTALSDRAESSANDNASDTVAKKPDRNILYIQSGQGVVIKGIENNLEAAGFNVISIPDEPDRIITHRKDADIIIYYPVMSDTAHIGITMSLLGEICQDDNKILCLTGELTDINTAMMTNGSYRVSRCYPRPVDIDQFISDIEYFYSLEMDLQRKKTIFVVDDDTSYLPVIGHWLSGSFNVSCFSGYEEALDGLRTVTPDLMILDYEMPGINGYELMKIIRKTYSETKIPIIFLTGKNDKDHVFHVLENKPDGYLLKTSQKETILDCIHRFFAETMFRLSLKEDR